MEGAMKCSANYVPLTPLSFLERAAVVYGERTSVIHGSTRRTWAQTRERCHKLASALHNMGVSVGDVVAVISPNAPALYELHFAVPIAGAIICPITVYYDVPLLAGLIRRSTAKLLFVDEQHLGAVHDALRLMAVDADVLPVVVPIAKPGVSSPQMMSPSYRAEIKETYEILLSSGDPKFQVQWPADEFDPISVCFTSGTTEVPKGVIHNHRAAFLNSIATILLQEMPPTPTFLWTVPIYHCNGWSFIWGVAAQGGTNVFIDEISAGTIYEAIAEHDVTNLGGGVTVLNMIAKAGADERRPLQRAVGVFTGGSPPPPDVLFNLEAQGFNVTHSGGQTETYCAAIYCVWKPEWDSQHAERRAQLKARQGLPHIVLADADVKDPATMKSVPHDGRTVGEVVYKGNNIMSGYIDAEATREAFRGGWFHSGDLGVRHPDGYIEFKDRMKDKVVHDGRMIGTIEIESLLYGHPAVHAAGVVGMEGRKGAAGSLCAFVQLKEGHHATEEDILEFCRYRLPEDMAPAMVVFDVIPFTSTGKTKKAVLRQKAGELAKKLVGSLCNGTAAELASGSGIKHDAVK